MQLVTPQAAPELTAGLLDAIGSSEAPAVGAMIIRTLPQLTPAAKTAALRVLLARPQSTRELLGALQAGQVEVSDLTLEQKQSLANHPDKQIAALAAKVLASGGGLPNPDRQRVVTELLVLTEETGDPVAGKQVFKKHCMKCHMHSGQGNKIGPDLTGMAVHPKHELLVHLIDPSRSVEGNFRVYQVVTSDGRVFSGLLASETKTTIELYDTEGKKHAILREEIEELVASKKSLMPDGFEKQVSRDDIRNLLEFLTQRGRFVPLPLSKVATFVSTRPMFYGSADHEKMIFPAWDPVT